MKKEQLIRHQNCCLLQKDTNPRTHGTHWIDVCVGPGAPVTHQTGGWVGQRTTNNLNVLANIKVLLPGTEPQSSGRHLLTELA